MTGPSVLIVDDNKVDRMSIRRQLRDYEVLEASTATEGLALCRARKPACVLVDYRLPDQDGINIIENLKEERAAVIMLTGQGAESIAVTAIKAGASDYLVKGDLTHEVLSRAVRAALRERTHLMERELLRTERDRLRSSTDQLLMLVQNTSDFIATLSPEGRFLFVNEPGRALVEWPVDRPLVDETLSAVLEPRALERYLVEVFPEALELGVWRGSSMFRSQRGANIPVDMVVVVKKDETGEPLYAATVSRDMRDRNNLEAQLRQSQKMEAVGRLAGGVAHDFNNALTAIFSFSEFALNALPPDSSAREDIQEIQNAATRSEQLTRQLLSFSRKRTVEPRCMDPIELIDSIRRMLKRLVGENVELEVHDRDAGMTFVDPGALEQVLVNLAVNARDAMPNGGRLTIETDTIDVTGRFAAAQGNFVPEGEYVTISVSDTGVGMDDETLSHIFEPFFTTKSVHKGTGLGLSTVYGIITQAEGYIWVYTERGSGTTFRILLPRTRTPEETVRRPIVALPSRGNEFILVVEDDEQIRRLAERALQQVGYRVMSVARGQAALALIERDNLRVDLLLSDVVMPGMSGTEVAERIGALGAPTKVLFMSGYAPNAIIHHGVLGRGLELLQKPFSPVQLIEKVRYVLDSDGPLARDLSSLKERLLVVDNDARVSETVKSVLGDSFDVVSARSGEVALEMIKRRPPDRILCECWLPGVNGRQLYEAVFARSPELAASFVFMVSPGRAHTSRLPAHMKVEVLEKPLMRDRLLGAFA